MTSRLRSPSLLWTFAGAFLVVLVLSAALQALIVFRVIAPLSQQWLERDARTLAENAARALAIELAKDGAVDPDSTLRGVAHEARDFTLLYRDQRGDLFSDRPLPRSRQRWIRAVLPDSNVADTLAAWRERWARAEEMSGRDGRPPRRLPRVFASAQVRVDGTLRGTVIAYSISRDPHLLPPGGPRPGLLYFPVAALLAGGAGFWLFRVLSHRLRLLEAHTQRVKAGDLSARVADPGPDEIGRLGRSLNDMTASLAEARAQLDELEAQRRRFLADVTHELATPLTSIHGYAQTLLDPKVSISSEEQSRYLGHILSEASRMELLVREILDLARLEAGAAALQLEEIDWTALCRNACARFESRFGESGLVLAWRGSTSSAWVRGDGRRLEQVIDNLLSNALRYVPRGGTVEVSMHQEKGEALLRVEDDGPGFAAQDLPRLFDRFYRADAARTAGGAGLGLAIVREIVERHGGQARASNRGALPGADRGRPGARIEISLPLSGQGSGASSR